MIRPITMTATDSFIILFFPSFAGGKFLSNCLSLSKYCVPQDGTAAAYLLDHLDDYQYRLDCVAKTLPPTQLTMANWISQYEFGERRLYGDIFKDWSDGVPNYELNHITQRIIESNVKTFLTAHGGEQTVANLYHVWPNSSIIKLINHRKFSSISWSLKSDGTVDLDSHAGNYCEHKYSQLAGPDWPSWHEFEQCGFDARALDHLDSAVQEEILDFYNWRNINSKASAMFDVDNNYFDQQNFLTAVKSLYHWAGFDDFNPELVKLYWRAYINLHRT